MSDTDTFISFQEAIQSPGVYIDSEGMWSLVVGTSMQLVNNNPAGPAWRQHVFPPTPGQFNGILCFPLRAVEGMIIDPVSVMAQPAAGVQGLTWRKLEHLELRLCLKS